MADVAKTEDDDTGNEISSEGSRSTVVDQASNEIVFAIVGHVGSGTSLIATELQEVLNTTRIGGDKYDVHVSKARDVINEWAEENGEVPPSEKPAGSLTHLEVVKAYQDLGDRMRKERGDHTAVAVKLVSQIRKNREANVNTNSSPSGAIMPDRKPRAYILDSIRHPEEVELLRHIYQDAFLLIGVVCEKQVRRNRLMEKYEIMDKEAIKLMDSDAEDGRKHKHGQHTEDAFHLSDYFINNTENMYEKEKFATREKILAYHESKETTPTSNGNWDVHENLGRLINIITRQDIVRPKIHETGMHHAYSAKMRSMCLSRQVGASLVAEDGTLLATGTNEVPKAGGGVYGEEFDEGKHVPDHRCAKGNNFCSNTKQQKKIIKDVVKRIDKFTTSIDVNFTLTDGHKDKLKEILMKSRIGGLLEFSRAVHAEMDAILSASREGFSTIGTRMYVTTFPCHYCARHIVTAGIDEVQYIEPYPKSEALKLHDDAITEVESDWLQPSKALAMSKALPEAMSKTLPKAKSKASPESGGKSAGKVLFKPFSGVAPRMYRRAFHKNEDLKDDKGNKINGKPDWGTPWHLRQISYIELEALLLDKEGRQS